MYATRGEGVKESEFFADVIFGSPLSSALNWGHDGLGHWKLQWLSDCVTKWVVGSGYHYSKLSNKFTRILITAKRLRESRLFAPSG